MRWLKCYLETVQLITISGYGIRIFEPQCRKMYLMTYASSDVCSIYSVHLQSLGTLASHREPSEVEADCGNEQACLSSPGANFIWFV